MIYVDNAELKAMQRAARASMYDAQVKAELLGCGHCPHVLGEYRTQRAIFTTVSELLCERSAT